ncbi:energy transducer TonB [Ramlibacter sp. WS9]|uniref:energy transducer TonB n=1 Tax=Ramlibacter sp. WS9 TaxID=1882741 RepID=UPI001144E70A|nr:energy transducer TonB [Ramlibacter sp. WS9]ROZ66559.1 energy transducer TonB [Ramlibacter sp. WS9]
MPRLSRNYVIAGSVVLFHAAALWALQSGLVRRTVELVVPVEMLSELISPPAPQVQSPPAPQPPAPVKQPTPQKLQRATAPAPQPVAIAETAPAPAPDAPTGVVSPQPPAPPMAVAAAGPPAPPAPPKIELPSSSADYLQNPKPVYPPLSKRLGEQGKVMVRVLIAADGTVQSATLAQSSGYTRLDESALAAVLKWRFVPGKRGGVAEAMWHQIPVNFVLE